MLDPLTHSPTVARRGGGEELVFVVCLVHTKGVYDTPIIKVSNRARTKESGLRLNGELGVIT